MKSRFVVVALVILALAVPVSMLAQQSKAEKEIRVVLDEITKANLKGGTEALPVFEKYYADEFVRVPPNGAIYTKAEILEGFKTGRIKVESTELSDLKIRISGNVAVATAIVKAKSQVIDAAMAAPMRYTRVFVKRDGIWKCVLYQYTLFTK